MTPLGNPSPPPLPRWLGYAGLLPQVLALIAVAAGDVGGRFTALALSYAYAALILSFLGGMWWGLAAQARAPAPRWVWFAAVAPSLIALVSAVPWATGDAWPGPSMALLGLSLLGSLFVDYRMRAAGLCPDWWLSLRLPLSIGLGVLTLAIGYLA
ncbi:DUF3429 domain-containing protein [Sphingomonas sp. R86521]|uniref:DUF3429 domain-containing protein n=1 Tax=Sphingomonas sp. R86521 TaxID=3093860 RepID=UPI0036D2F303